jgi:tellurite methyltransferase
MQNKYWNEFYKRNHNFDNNPSSFCLFVIDYLKDYPNNEKIIDLGCGNGRDLFHFFQSGYNCTGIDNSVEIYKILKSVNSEIDMICHSFVDYDYNNFDIYYSRFTLHALPYDDIIEFINNVSEKMNENSILFIETRSTIGTEYEELDYIEANFKSGIGEIHKRTLFKKECLVKLFNKKSIFCEFEIEDKGLSPYMGEDPYLIRLVLKKINKKLQIKKLISEVEKKQFYIKKIVDEYIEILNRNGINYSIFFGNLLGLIRHDSLFIPWDDDIDIVINKEDLNRVQESIKKESSYKIDEIKISDTTLIFIIKNIWIDFFYNLKEFHGLDEEIDLSKSIQKNNYKYPLHFESIFEKFYNQKIEEILKTCVIYNHSYNNRWRTNNFNQLRIDIDECNDLVKESRIELNNFKVESFKEYYIESGNVYYLDTNFFNTIEELNNFLIKIVKIQKYKKIYLLADEFFEHKFQKLDIDFEKSKIIVTGENLVDKKSIELLGNNIESIFINSIRVDKLNYTEEIFSTIKKINQKFGVVFFGLSLLLLTQNKKIKILQFMLIDKKIQDIGLLEGKNKHWISFEFDGFQIEIFEYIQVENDLFVYEDVYKNTLLYDKLKYNVLDFDGLIMNPYLRLHNLKLKEEEIKFMFE